MAGAGDGGGLDDPPHRLPVQRAEEPSGLAQRAVDAHFDAYIGEVLKRVPPEARGEHGFNGVLLDSYEVHGQNWTQGFEREFKARAGYDITPWLPVLAGFPMESAAATDRFLRDYLLNVPDDELAIQVAYSIADPDTLHRESSALGKLPQVHPCRRRIIITYDEEGTLEDKYGTIEVIPAWKWLLEEY